MAKGVHDTACKRGFFLKDSLIDNNLFCITKEVVEASNAVRDNARADHDKMDLDICEGKSFKDAYVANVKDTVEAEMASIIIAALSVCHELEIDVDLAVSLERSYNRVRAAGE